MMTKKVSVGRPRVLVDFGLILDLRENENLGWFRIAKEYTSRTGQYISKQTCKRRYIELKRSNCHENMPSATQKQ
jgi:hypothetical protein